MRDGAESRSAELMTRKFSGVTAASRTRIRGCAIPKRARSASFSACSRCSGASQIRVAVGKCVSRNTFTKADLPVPESAVDRKARFRTKLRQEPVAFGPEVETCPRGQGRLNDALGLRAQRAKASPGWLVVRKVLKGEARAQPPTQRRHIQRAAAQAGFTRTTDDITPKLFGVLRGSSSKQRARNGDRIAFVLRRHLLEIKRQRHRCSR